MKKSLRWLLETLLLLLMLLMQGPSARGEYWDADREIHCREHRPACRLLQTVMLGSFEGDATDSVVALRVLSAVYPRLREIDQADIDHFLSEFDEDAERVTRHYYAALANSLRADLLMDGAGGARMSPARQVLLLFLSPESQPNAQAQMAEIRAAMSDEALRRIAEAEELDVDFVKWVIEADQ